jgi:hypothetical protein
MEMCKPRLRYPNAHFSLSSVCKLLTEWQITLFPLDIRKELVKRKRQFYSVTQIPYGQLRDNINKTWANMPRNSYVTY